jgi:hypothetical protein
MLCYSHGRAKISIHLNKLLHEFTGLTQAIKPKIFFWEVNVLLLLDKLPHRIIPHIITE